LKPNIQFFLCKLSELLGLDTFGNLMEESFGIILSKATGSDDKSKSILDNLSKETKTARLCQDLMRLQAIVNKTSVNDYFLKNALKQFERFSTITDSLINEKQFEALEGIIKEA
jgi:hypothetical protein